MTTHQIEQLRKLALADSSILKLFETDAREQISEIKLFLREGNTSELKKKIHALKGSAGLFLADSCVEVCQTFEEALRTNSAADFNYLVSSLDRELALYCQNLQKLQLLN